MATSRRSRKVLTETMQIDPAQHAAVTSDGRWTSFLHALAGILYALRHQRNTWIMGSATVVVVGVAIWAGVSRLEWALLVVTIGMVWVAEFLNSAVEAAVDVASPQHHPMAKVAKDVAAGAVLTASVIALIVGLVVLGPAVADRL